MGGSLPQPEMYPSSTGAAGQRKFEGATPEGAYGCLQEWVARAGWMGVEVTQNGGRHGLGEEQ